MPDDPHAGVTAIPDTELGGDAGFMGPAAKVSVNGVELAYRQFGSGPDLLMITGDTAPMSLWLPYVIKPLAESFRVTIFDNRGMGYSTDDPSKELSIERMAHDTAGLIEALGLVDATLVGWSMGAEIAVTMAALDIGADGIGRIVSSGGDAGSSHTIQPSAELLKALSDPDTSTQAGLELMFPQTDDGKATMMRFLKGIGTVPQETPSEAVLARQEQAESGFLKVDRVWDALGKIDVPVLVTNGELDPGVPPDNARNLAERIPGARLSIFEGAGHGMMFQSPDRFASEVKAFYDQSRPAGA